VRLLPDEIMQAKVALRARRHGKHC
jgi:hypothetical protein